VVDFHFDLPPVGTSYWDNRHKVLFIICTVLKKNDVSLACPVYRVVHDTPGTEIENGLEISQNKGWFHQKQM
jgi:hypothetical protein